MMLEGKAASAPRIAIVGKGALGLMYAGIIQDALGDGSVCFVMDDERFERHHGEIYSINGVARYFRDVRPAEAEPVDLVLMAVKATVLEEALELVPPLLGPDTVIVPVLNGITSERRCAARFGWERVVACVAAAMDSKRTGTAIEYTRAGRLILGALETTPPETVERAARILEAGGITCVIPADIVHEMWMKFMVNTGLNQVCAAYGLTYEELHSDEEAEPFRTYIGTMREVIAVSGPAGVGLTEADMNFYIDIIRSLDPTSTPSMAQDVLACRPTEVDEFSGEVIRRADEYGIYVPCNRYLHRRIRKIEVAYGVG